MFGTACCREGLTRYSQIGMVMGLVQSTEPREKKGVIKSLGHWKHWDYANTQPKYHNLGHDENGNTAIFQQTRV